MDLNMDGVIGRSPVYANCDDSNSFFNHCDHPGDQCEYDFMSLENGDKNYCRCCTDPAPPPPPPGSPAREVKWTVEKDDDGGQAMREWCKTWYLANVCGGYTCARARDRRARARRLDRLLPADVHDRILQAAFRDFDPDSSGEIEFAELEKALKKSFSMSALKKVAKVTGKVAALQADATDVAGDGRGDFSNNMKIKASAPIAEDDMTNEEISPHEPMYTSWTQRHRRQLTNTMAAGWYPRLGAFPEQSGSRPQTLDMNQARSLCEASPNCMGFSRQASWQHPADDQLTTYLFSLAPINDTRKELLAATVLNLDERWTTFLKPGLLSKMIPARFGDDKYQAPWKLLAWLKQDWELSPESKSPSRNATSAMHRQLVQGVSATDNECGVFLADVDAKDIKATSAEDKARVTLEMGSRGGGYVACGYNCMQSKCYAAAS